VSSFWATTSLLLAITLFSDRLPPGLSFQLVLARGAIVLRLFLAIGGLADTILGRFA